jgi:hypothetical protein
MNFQFRIRDQQEQVARARDFSLLKFLHLNAYVLRSIVRKILHKCFVHRTQDFGNDLQELAQNEKCWSIDERSPFLSILLSNAA